MTEHDSLLVLGVDPGPTRPASLAAWTVLRLDPFSGRVTVQHRSTHLSKAALAEHLKAEPLMSDPRLRVVAMAGPMTPTLIERKPWRARAVEIRLSRGAFSGVARGPWMPWLSSSRTWPRYLRTAELQAICRDHGFPLLAMPTEDKVAVIPSRGLAEVYPKATLALLTSRGPLLNRPSAQHFLGELDDWLFPRLFTDGESSTPIQATLQSTGLGLQLAPETIDEARRIAGLRRPLPRREPMRAFLAALQGVLALREGACLVGAPGEQEGSILLPATWHPDWNEEWNQTQQSARLPQLRRLPVETACPNRQDLLEHLDEQPPIALTAPAFTRKPTASSYDFHKQEAAPS